MQRENRQQSEAAIVGGMVGIAIASPSSLWFGGLAIPFIIATVLFTSGLFSWAIKK